MSECRPPLGPSLSFGQPSSSSSSTSFVAKFAAKRRIASTSALEFFAPAAKSFQPLPYTPHAPYGQPQSRTKGFAPRHPSRTHDSLAIPGMDPQPTDPDVVFIHPPFSTFPKADKHPDGISYQVMADNPEWFLDANDFISATNTNPQAIPYPNNLEPPRGWCPARKKDLKERGSDTWPEGEEPRLRCTFCRRTYAGVNAKSMWRRHVFEKHKIAMSNRRDGNDRPRGRGSGKENKQTTSSHTREEPHDRILSLQVAPQTEPQNTSHKSRFRSLKPIESKSSEKAPTTPEVTQAPAAQQEHPPESDTDNKPLDSDHSHPTPPTSPQTSLGSDHDSVFKDSLNPAQSPRSLTLASPYNPLSTPSFRHSPARLPSAWRFGSPSHPLHSEGSEVSLAMLMRDGASPFVKFPSGLSGSPLVRSSPMSTPNESLLRTPSTSNASTKGFPRSWLVKGPLGSPLEKHSKRSYKEFSPLSRGSLEGSLHRRTPSRPDDWLSGDLDLGFQTPWPAILSDDASPTKRTRPFVEPESPIVRRAKDGGVSLGIGLLDPFVLAEDAPTSDDIEAEINEILESSRDKRGPLTVPRKQRPSEEPLESSPPPKKRRMSLEG